MRKFLFVATEPMAPECEKVFISLLRSKDFGWWHRLPTFWILEVTDDYEPVDVFEDLKRILPTGSFFVGSMLRNGWHARGSKEDGFFDWLEQALAEKPTQSSRELLTARALKLEGETRRSLPRGPG